mgnify:CR=1 FL=1
MISTRDVWTGGIQASNQRSQPRVELSARCLLVASDVDCHARVCARPHYQALRALHFVHQVGLGSKGAPTRQDGAKHSSMESSWGMQALGGKEPPERGDGPRGSRAPPRQETVRHCHP